MGKLYLNHLLTHIVFICLNYVLTGRYNIRAKSQDIIMFKRKLVSEFERDSDDKPIVELLQFR